MAESACREFDARNFAVLWMTAEYRIIMAKCFQFFTVEEAFIGQYGIQGNAAMSLTQNTAVSIWPVRLVNGSLEYRRRELHDFDK